MRTIDVHTHTFPDHVAERAIAKLEAECPWKAIGSGKVADLLASMDAAGVAASVICAIATKPDQADGILKWCQAIRGDRIVPFPSVHPRTQQAGTCIRRVAEAGFTGVKLHPMYQDFAIDDPALDEIYASCQSLGLVIAFHCGRDIAYPPDDDRAAPARTAAVLRRFPELKVISTHMGGWRMWDESDRELVGQPNVWFETSFSLDGLGPQRAADMIRRHGVDRVLFGSDWPWTRQDAGLAMLDALPLTPGEIAAIRGENAARLLGI
jgi:uncharacterized protein